jgi:hypothetical protein
LVAQVAAPIVATWVGPSRPGLPVDDAILDEAISLAIRLIERASAAKSKGKAGTA